MKKLLLMRHAKSSWQEPGLSDHDRPLNARGNKAAPMMAQYLLSQDLRPDLVICSTAQRAKETARLVTGVIENVDVAPYSQLYLSDEESYLEVIQTIPNDVETLLLVGHNPTMEYLNTALCGAAETFSTAAIAHLEVEIDSWFDLKLNPACNLLSFCRPRELEELT